MPERRSYILNDLVSTMRSMARGTQTDLDALVEEVTKEYIETGTISGASARRILAFAAKAQNRNQRLVTILGLMDSASLEDAQKEMQMQIVPKLKAAGS